MSGSVEKDSVDTYDTLEHICEGGSVVQFYTAGNSDDKDGGDSKTRNSGVEGRPLESFTIVAARQDTDAWLVPHIDPVVTANDVMDTILVKGLSTTHNSSVLKLYFTNRKKSGGGDVTEVVIQGTQAYISFADSNVAARVADKKFHKIVGGTVEVELVAPAGPIESVTSDDPNSHDNYDNILILDNVPQTVQDEVLLLYIDSMTELDGEDGDYTIDRNNTEVVVTFKPDNMPPAGFDSVIDKISNTSLDENLHFQARCPVVTDPRDQLCKSQKTNANSNGKWFLPRLKSKLNKRHSKKEVGNCGISVGKMVKEDDNILVEKKNTAEDDVMSCTTVNISNDIAQFLSTARGNSLLQNYLQSFGSIFTVQFNQSGQLVLLCSSKDDGIRAAKRIEEQVISVCVPLSLPTMFLPLFESQEWISLWSNLEEIHSVSINLASDKLTILGDKGLLVAVEKSIQNFLEDNCFVEKSVPLCWAQWRLLTTHMSVKWINIKQELENETMIQYVIPNTGQGGLEPSIILKGRKQVVTYFAKEVENLVLSMRTSPLIEQARPGTVKFFNSEKGTTLVREIELEEKSCIQLDVLHDGDMKDGSSASCCTKLCTGETKDGTIITLVEGNITEFPVDVIVNAANCNLNHIGGVALAIAEKGGPTIQDDSNLYIRREGKLSDGDAVMAKEVGQLPCKRLIHAVGPKWTGGLNYEEAILKKVCMESLKLASDYKTISFPAISSGMFGFPENKCASCMMEAFLEYFGSSTLSVISEVTVIVCNKSFVSAFTEEMYKNLSNFQSARQVLEGVQSSYPQVNNNINNREPIRHTTSKSNLDIITQFIQLHKGELLKEKADIFVNTVGGDLNLNTGAVSKSLLRAGGQTLQDECTAYIISNGAVPVGGMVVTEPGAICCKNIIHTVGQSYDGKQSEQILQRLVLKCLEMCDSLKASTIAFPALGAGTLNYPPKVVADIMISTAVSYLKANYALTCIKTVKLVIYMDDAFVQFNEALYELTLMGTDNQSDCYARDVPSPMGTSSVHSDSSVLRMQIYAETVNGLKKTRERLQRIIDDQFTTDALTDELIAKLSDEKKTAFMTKAKQRHVEIVINTSAPLIYIQFRGDRNDVADLVHEIQKELNQIRALEIQKELDQIRALESLHKEAKLLQGKVKWCWWANDSNEYKDFDYLTNYYIEQAYQTARTSVFAVTTKDFLIECDLMKMEAKINNSVHKIRRADLVDLFNECKHPSNWSKMPKDVTCTLVELNPTNQEYMTIKSKFEDSMCTSQQPFLMVGIGVQKCQIIKIERVQNIVLHSQYMARKRTMDMKNPPGTINEMELFHGCPGDVAEKISHQGYNRSFGGRNAMVYGKGVYFAHDASYSANDRYSSRDKNGYKYMFLSRVLTGQYTAGSPYYITPPPKSPNSHDLFDSVVDDIHNPSIFVIFADAQAYPDYLITFT